MQRIDKIREYVQEFYAQSVDGENGLTAENVAQSLNIWRSDASRDLNKLVRMGILRKTEGYPVCFFPNEPACIPKKPFDRIIGSEGSLKHQIQTARAAASYPPYGLNTFIIGESGVGKTMLAEEIWCYQCLLKKDDKIPFVSYNCAEHTDNPQLLLSHLFGHVKGAFTGADYDKKGIVESANGGILLLDEIHRLPKAGQEMLFTVMDKGVLRPLGGIENRKVNLMIIGATTECLDTTVLDTFKRRMPIVINIPKLSERTLKERLDLVSLFFQEECKKLSLEIRVSREVVRYLVGFESKTNIGDLKNEIQICCAKAYLNYIDKDIKEKESFIRVTKKELSRTTVMERKNGQDIERFIEEIISEEGIIIQSTEVVMNPQFSHVKEGVSAKEWEYKRGNDSIGNVSLNNWNMAKSIAERLQEELSGKFDEDVTGVIALWLEEMRSGAYQGITSSKILETGIEILESGEKKFLETVIVILRDEFEITLAEGEGEFLTMLLRKHMVNQYTEKPGNVHFGMVLISKTKDKASNISQLVNEAFNTTLVCPVESTSETEKEYKMKIVEAVKKFKKRKGIIIFTDDKKMVPQKKYIQAQTGIPCNIIAKMDLAIVTEMAKTIFLANESQNMDTLCGIVTRSDSIGKFMDLFMGKSQ